MNLSYNTAFKHLLADNTNITFRQLTLADRERLRIGISLLSDESAYRRFFGPMRQLSDNNLDYLSQPNQFTHVAWGAMSDEYTQLPGLGTARFVVVKDAPDRAEFAITIIDEFQGRGLGTCFMALLYLLARFHNLSHLYGIILPSNQALLNRFKKLNAKVEFTDGNYELLLPILLNKDDLPNNDFTLTFKKLLLEFENKLLRHSIS